MFPTLRKEEWEERFGNLTTMAMKREAILNYLKSSKERYDRLVLVNEERFIAKNGWFIGSELRIRIAFVMGWYTERPERSWFGLNINYDAQMDDERVTETMKRMEAQGYIKLSKSGNGYKILKY